MTLKWWGLLGACAAGIGCTCAPPGAIRPCSSTSDCEAEEVCLDGACATATSPSGDGGEDVDRDGGGGGHDGGADAGCPAAAPCGAACCAVAQVCDKGTCRLDCGAAPRCGEPSQEVCCGAAQVCYFGACVTPGAPCTRTADCPAQAYCESTLGRCLPRAGTATCSYRPPTATFNPSVLWSYQADGGFDQVMMTPIVVDLNDDGAPDVLANFFAGGKYTAAGVLRALSGSDGHLLWESATPPSTIDAGAPAMWIRANAQIAAADLEGTGGVTVLTTSHDGLLMAFEGRTGKQLWPLADGGLSVPCSASEGMQLADLDSDGKAEIICGATVYDSRGRLRWNKGGSASTVVDLDGDGHLDVTTGATAFRGDGTALGWTGTGFGGRIAVGDLVSADGGDLPDGVPELAVVSAGRLAVVNGQSGAVIGTPIYLPGANGGHCEWRDAGFFHSDGGRINQGGGPPTVADFDGDGKAEVGVASFACYTVFEVDPAATPSLRMRWTGRVRDYSSSATGSAVFDFDGDGKAEVVYADETALHVYNGTDGAEIFTRPHCSGTLIEYPVIVDVNGNGRAEIVLAENTYAASNLGCDGGTRPGITVLRDTLDNWVNTRPIWNQHHYHVTNVCDGRDWVCGGPNGQENQYARVPRSEPPNVRFSDSSPNSATHVLNNYRQNVQGEGMFDAPDLLLRSGEAAWGGEGCGDGVTLRVRLVNQGSLGVLPGVPVAFYDGTTLLGVVRSTARLLPGESELLTLAWTPPPGTTFPRTVRVVADDEGSGQSSLNECHEDNNALAVVVPGCIVIN